MFFGCYFEVFVLKKILYCRTCFAFWNIEMKNRRLRLRLFAVVFFLVSITIFLYYRRMRENVYKNGKGSIMDCCYVNPTYQVPKGAANDGLNISQPAQQEKIQKTGDWFCGLCGTKNSSHQKYCVSCGKNRIGLN